MRWASGQTGRLGASAVVLAFLMLATISATPDPALAATGGQYGGGPVETHPRVYLIFWGGWWCADSTIVGSTCAQPTDPQPPLDGPQYIEEHMEDLFTRLAGSRYNAILSQYCQGVANGATSCSGASAADFVHNDTELAGAYIYTKAATKSPTTNVAWDTAIINQVVPDADAANGWVPTSNTQYIVLPEESWRVDKAISAANGGHGCSNHGTETGKIGLVSFDKVPVPPLSTDPDPGACGADPTYVTKVVTTYASHEYAEEVTDPNPTVNGAVQPGWTFPTGEIADDCAGAKKYSAPAELNGETVAWLDNLSSNGDCTDSLQTATTPANVTATAGGPGKATVQWQASSPSASLPIVGYEVSSQEGGSGPFQLARTVSTGDTSAALTGLNGGSAYVFSVRALVGGDIGPPGMSSPLSVTGPAQPYTRRVLASDPSIYYRLDDVGTSPIAEDSSGHGSDAQWTSGTPSASALTNDTDQAVSDHGSAGVLVDTHSGGLPLGNAPRTVEMWVDPGSVSEPEDLFDYGIPSTASSFGAKIVDANTLDVWTWNNDVTFTLPYAHSFSSGWNQIAIVYDGGRKVTAYLDGLSLGSATLAKQLNTEFGDPGLVIGSGAGGAGFDGSLDEFSIYASALRPTDIRTHYTAAGYTLSPDVGFDPSPLSFGAIRVGSSVTQTEKVHNYGSTSLAIGPVNLSGDPGFTIASNGCSGVSVAAGKFCSIGVRFSPTSLADASATLSVTDPLADSPQTLAVTGTGTGAWGPVPLAGAPGIQLNSIRGVSADNVWAVGSSAPGGNRQPLIEHWDGHAWSVLFHSPVSGFTDSELTGAAAVSKTLAYAVGFGDTATGQGPIIVRWNGVTWSKLSTGSSPASSLLYGVSADSSKDVWAVGYSSTGYPQQSPFVEHWNGTSWSTMSPPVQSGWNGNLNAVVALSATNVWAVGSTTTGNTASTRVPLIEHWNGSAWSRVSHPVWTGGNGASLTGIAAASASDIWVVGSANGGIAGHWDGSTWTDATPANLTTCDQLDDIAAPSSSNVVVVGLTGTGGSGGEACGDGYDYALARMWNGSAWSTQQPPGPKALLDSVYADPNGQAWAIGRTCLAASCAPFAERYR